MKRIKFDSRLEAIDWIAQQVEEEGQFEVLREQLNFNFIYTETYYLDLKDDLEEVVLLRDEK